MILSADNYTRHRLKVLDGEMSYIDEGDGDPIVFLHGNPTSAYLWRNIIPHVEKLGRCLAPDLIGMGQSSKLDEGSYRFEDHARYLDGWFDALHLTDRVTLVIHDWGSALGFHRAHRFPESIRAIIYMEGIVRPVSWKSWPDAAQQIFQAMRSPVGEEMILEKNVFVERILPGSVIRDLTEEEMSVYRMPFMEPGESRRPTLTWPREIPIEGEPSDVHAIVEGYANWIKDSDIPKLFINAEPGAILINEQREFCRSWRNQEEVTVNGIHFIQEDSPDEIGKAIESFIVRL